MGIATTSLRTGLAMTRLNRTVIPRSEATWESPMVFRRVAHDSAHGIRCKPTSFGNDLEFLPDTPYEKIPAEKRGISDRQVFSLLSYYSMNCTAQNAA